MMSERDYLTAAMVNIQCARDYNKDGGIDPNGEKADMMLFCAQIQLLSAGAKDIGEIEKPTDIDAYRSKD